MSIRSLRGPQKAATGRDRSLRRASSVGRWKRGCGNGVDGEMNPIQLFQEARRLPFEEQINLLGYWILMRTPGIYSFRVVDYISLRTWSTHFERSARASR